jgi:lactoylglutathione lyase
MDIQIKYVTMIVKDMDESIKFYTDVMGFEVDSQYHPQPETFITLMRGKGDALLELIQAANFEIGLYSVGMDVKDLNATLTELKSKGAKITMEPVSTLVGRMAFMQDPNGVRFALIQHNP